MVIMHKNVSDIATVSGIWIENKGVYPWGETYGVSTSIRFTWMDCNSIVAMPVDSAAAFW